MADEPPRRPRGRPPLKDGEVSVSVNVRLPTSEFDQAAELARKHQTSMGAIFRAALRRATRRQETLEEE